MAQDPLPKQEGLVQDCGKYRSAFENGSFPTGLACMCLLLTAHSLNHKRSIAKTRFCSLEMATKVTFLEKQGTSHEKEYSRDCGDYLR